MKSPTLKWRRALPGACLLLLSAITPAISDPGVLFVSNRDGALQIYRIAADGTGEARLTDSQGNNQPAWSPDGRRFAFTSVRDGNPEIYTANADGSAVRRLTDHPAADVRPAWSPDGKQIAFVSGRQGRDDIWLMQADGSGQRLLTAVNGGLGGGGLIWSPDGSRLYFLMSVGTKHQVFSINADGSNLTDLTSAFSKGSKGEPDLSPDGQWLVFTTAEDRSPVNLVVMRSDGSEGRQITRAQGDNYSPRWSPDGRHIAFVSSRDDLVRSEIYVSRPDGSDARNVSLNPRDDFEPRWLDAHTVLFVSMRDPITQLYSVDIASPQPRRITRSQALELEPTPFVGGLLSAAPTARMYSGVSPVLNRQLP